MTMMAMMRDCGPGVPAAGRRDISRRVADAPHLCSRSIFVREIPFLALVALLLFSTPLAGQDPDCESCELQLREVARLGDRDGPGALHDITNIVRVDGRGRFVIARSGGTELLVFDSNGRFIQQVGREGDGPGEFRNAPSIVFGPGDSLYVFDNGQGRLSVFDPGFRLVRTAPVASVPGPRTIALEDGRFVAALPLRTPERVGYPLHLLDAEGTIVKSFGSLTREYGPGIQQSMSRTLAPGAGGIIWAAKGFRYEITAWDTTNAVRARITREPDWFPPRVDRPPRSGGGPHEPEPSLQAIHEAVDGTLRVAVLVAAENWRSAIREVGPGAYRLESPLDHRDSIIEVLDRSGRLLARTRVEGWAMGFLRDGRIAIGMLDEDGFPYMSIREVVRIGTR
jgi:hypothetical protein